MITTTANLYTVHPVHKFGKSWQFLIKQIFTAYYVFILVTFVGLFINYIVIVKKLMVSRV